MFTSSPTATTNTRYVTVRNMRPGDRFLSNRRGWVTVQTQPRMTADLNGMEVQVLPDDGEPYMFASISVYRVYRPAHRREVPTDSATPCSETTVTS